MLLNKLFDQHKRMWRITIRGEDENTFDIVDLLNSVREKLVETAQDKYSDKWKATLYYFELKKGWQYYSSFCGMPINKYAEFKVEKN